MAVNEHALGTVEARRDPRLRLVTFSHAGGGAAQFIQWAPSLPEFVSLSATRRAGREVRFREPTMMTIDPMAREAVEALAALPKRKTVLFGHSIGSLIAYEVAQMLEAKGESPVLLIVSARSAPHLPLAGPPLARLSDERLIEESMRQYGSFPGHGARTRELIELMLGAIRGDLDASEQYRAPPGPRVRCPIWVCRGTEDKSVAADRSDQWSTATSGTTTHTAFRGGHFYVFDPASGFLDGLVKKLVEVDSSSAGAPPPFASKV